MEGGRHQLADMFQSTCRDVFELSGMLAMHQLAPLQILSEMSLESVTFQIATSVLEHNPLNAQKPNSHTFATVDRCFFPARLHYK